MNSSFDKNTIIGFVLLFVLFIAFFWYSNKSQQFAMQQEKRKQDSIARIEALKAKPTDLAAAHLDSLKRDSTSRVSTAGNFTSAALGTEQLVSVENKLMKVTFTNKGGKVKYVDLKNYHTKDGGYVRLGGDNDNLSYNINTSNNSAAANDQLFFTASAVQQNTDGSQQISFSLKDSSGKAVVHQYTIRPDEYMIDWNIHLVGAGQLLTASTLNMQIKQQMIQQERSSQYERRTSNVCFSEGNEFDYISAKNQHKFEKPVQWIAAVQQFFNTAVIAKNSFSGGELQWLRATDTTQVLGDVNASLQLKVPAGNEVNIPMQLYFGPNDYKVLKNEAPGMDKIVNLGRDAYSFVRPINKYVIMPVFDFFTGFVKNLGWAILLLTVFIRLVTSPLTYSSYLSGAKMKVLRPELDGLKKKFGADQQGYAMEQMKLFREAGVNPLGGCIPALLQIPIFFALYSFFNSNIALRGQSFLWSHDLSSYDVIAKLPFSLPLGFGDHISLFTITAVLTSFFISIYNMASTPTQDNPAMKYMPYIFPFMMLFFFNGLPSALTWYYTVSNSLTLLLQFIIQRYIIDHDKILAGIEEKRKSPKAKKSQSKWQERYQQMMESQKKLQELKNKNQNKG
ncbi:MAG: membrane protein insertase YidC [Bacteroidota bacterium]|nr:membrane protein insertase YidC [Bacteroidota bacterium]